MNRRVREKMEDSGAQDVAAPARSALGRLGRKSAKSTFRNSSSSQQGIRLPVRSTSSSNSMPKPFTVFEDPQGAPDPLPARSNEPNLWNYFPTEKEKRKENERNPSVWTNQGGILPPAHSANIDRLPSTSIVVFDDEDRDQQCVIGEEPNETERNEEDIKETLSLNEDMTINTKVAFAAVSDMFASPGFKPGNDVKGSSDVVTATPSFNEPIERQLHFSVFEDSVDDVADIGSLSMDDKNSKSTDRRPLSAMQVKKITNADVLRSKSVAPVRIFEDSPLTSNLVWND